MGNRGLDPFMWPKLGSLGLQTTSLDPFSNDDARHVIVMSDEGGENKVLWLLPSGQPT